MKKEKMIQYIKGMLCPPLYMDKILLQTSYLQKKTYLEYLILHSKEMGVTKHKYCNHDIIVSLTTFDERLFEVHLSIASIMEQTLKPNRIILWIDHKYKNQPLPKSLSLLVDRGLEIKYCNDIGPYTKLIPSLREFKDDAIITIDDDLIYDFDVLERLILQHIQEPNVILANRIHRISMKRNNRVLPYKKWQWSYEKQDAHPNNFPTGVGGVLYPPDCFDEEVFNENVFCDICKYADDIWFKAMALKKGTLSKKVYSHSPLSEDYLVNAYAQKKALNFLNVGADKNDVQFDAVFSKYDLYKKLKYYRWKK